MLGGFYFFFLGYGAAFNPPSSKCGERPRAQAERALRHFARQAIALRSHPSRRAQHVELESGESSGAIIHDGDVRARVEQQRGRLAVDLTFEQDHAAYCVESNDERSALLRARHANDEQKEKRAINVQ